MDANNVVPLERFKPKRSTLEEMHLEISEGFFPFIQFRTLIDGIPLMVVTIPWARFRTADENPGLMEVRSCDCGGSICGHPTQRLYIAKSLMKEWVFESTETMKYVFDFNIYDLAKG